MIMQVHICIPLYMWVYVFIIDPNIAFYFRSIYQLNQSSTQIFSVFLVCFVFAKKAKSIMDSFTHAQDNFLDVKNMWTLYLQNWDQNASQNHFKYFHSLLVCEGKSLRAFISASECLSSQTCPRLHTVWRAVTV